MANPKNQSELIRRFLKGETGGVVGHLLIYGDTLYNTENSEYMPVCRKLGPAGNCKMIVLNEYSKSPGHSNYSYQRELFEEVLREENFSRDYSGKIRVRYMRMNLTTRPEEKHKIQAKSIEGLIKYGDKLIASHTQKILNIKARAYEHTSEETNYTDDELIEASRQLIEEYEMVTKYLREEKELSNTTDILRDIEELVQAPHIMERAIKNGGMDPARLERMLKTRDRVKDVIDNVEKHIAIILSIPDGPHKLQGREFGETIEDNTI